MESFSFRNPENGVSIVVALIENGDYGSVVIQGDHEPKVVYAGAVEFARATFAREQKAYGQREKDGA